MPAWGIQIREDTLTPRLIGFNDRMRSRIGDRWMVLGDEMISIARGLVRVRTGYLRDSIFVDFVQTDLIFTFGATAPYAGFQEFGTWKMSAQPYLRPALDANQDRIVNAILMGITDAWNV